MPLMSATSLTQNLNNLLTLKRRKLAKKTSLSGKYEFIVNDEVMQAMKDDGMLNVVWAYDDRKVKEGQKYRLCRELTMVIHRKFEWCIHGQRVNGYTKIHCQFTLWR